MALEKVVPGAVSGRIGEGSLHDSAGLGRGVTNTFTESLREVLESAPDLLPPPVSCEVEPIGIYRVNVITYPGKFAFDDFGSNGNRPDSLDVVYDAEHNPFTVIRKHELAIFPGGEITHIEGALSVSTKVLDGTVASDELPPDERKLRGLSHIRDSSYGDITVAEYEMLRVSPGHDIVDIFGPYKRTIRVYSSRYEAHYSTEVFDADIIFAYNDVTFGEVTIMSKTELRIVPNSDQHEDVVDFNGHPVRVRQLWIEGHHNKDAFGLKDTPHRVTHERGLQNEPLTKLEYYIV